jgi:hypothetical protein
LKCCFFVMKTFSGLSVAHSPFGLTVEVLELTASFQIEILVTLTQGIFILKEFLFSKNYQLYLSTGIAYIFLLIINTL